MLYQLSYSRLAQDLISMHDLTVPTIATKVRCGLAAFLGHSLLHGARLKFPRRVQSQSREPKKNNTHTSVVFVVSAIKPQKIIVAMVAKAKAKGQGQAQAQGQGRNDGQGQGQRPGPGPRAKAKAEAKARHTLQRSPAGRVEPQPS